MTDLGWKKTSQIAKVQKKLRISVAISQFFVIEKGGRKKTAH